jgi:uncharacterized protein (DUF305 family)
MKTMILAPPRVLPPALLRATKPCASARGIFSSLLVAGSVSLAAAAAALPAWADSSPSLTEERPFIDENNAAMAKMMDDMTIKPTGDIDRDFVAMMVPHHQGAIDMAQTELRYGQNRQLLRISQEIVVEQLQEIAAMRIAVGEKVSPYQAMLAASVPGAAAAAAPAPRTAGTLSVAAERPFLEENDAAMTKMMDDMTIKPTGEIDRDFVAMMVPHHQGAIDMAQAELRYGHDAQLKRIAQEIIVDQIQQISLMRLAVGEPLPPSVSSPTNPTVPPQTGGQAGSPTGEQPPMKMDGAMRMSPGPSEPQAGDR